MFGAACWFGPFFDCVGPVYDQCATNMLRVVLLWVACMYMYMYVLCMYLPTKAGVSVNTREGLGCKRNLKRI